LSELDKLNKKGKDRGSGPTSKEHKQKARPRLERQRSSSLPDVNLTRDGKIVVPPPGNSKSGHPSMLAHNWAQHSASTRSMKSNSGRARYKWHKLSKLLTREGSNPRIFGMFHKAVVQTVLLFGCESWTVTDAVWNVLKGFCHRAARRMADMMAHRGPGGGWIYPPLEEALKKAGLCTMEHCVYKRQQRMVDCISTRPIWMHCMAASRKPGTSPRTVCWWDQKRRQAKPADEHWEDGTPCL